MSKKPHDQLGKLYSRF